MSTDFYERLAQECDFRPWVSRPPGGQQVGVHVCGIIAIHRASGIEARVRTERSQYHNKRLALEMIAGALTSPHWRNGL